MSGKSLLATAAILAAVFGGLAIQSASASPKATGPVQLGVGPTGWKLLVPASYPLDVSGRQVNGRIKVRLPGATWEKNWQARPHAGSLRRGDTRKRFRFVHGIRVSKKLAGRMLAAGGKAKVISTLASRSEMTASRGRVIAALSGIRQARPGLCETLPRVTVVHGKQRFRDIKLPACGRRLIWQIANPPEKGNYVRYVDRFRFFPQAGRTGADEARIEGSFRRGLVASQKIQLRVVRASTAKTSVVAFGDSVTAGFGYFGVTGKPMTIGQLLGCKPGATVLNDACSSNSYNRSSSVGTKPNYLPDYGLSRNISWAAQWANEHGITNFRNLAVTGSAPTDWLPGGQFHSTLEQIQLQNPGYILMTLGANPLLSDVLFNVDVMGCALESDLFGDFRQCVLDAFATVDLGPRMNQVFTELVENTTSDIVLMQYPLSIPSSAIAYSAVQLEQMESLLNEVIASEAAQVSTSRINVVTPPRFNVGIDMEPMYPSKYSCSFLGYKVDGPSVQSTPTQDELLVDHPLSFCSGPAIGPPWVISGDTGIHPSAAGYFQMASQIPAPGS